jgi:hypothetical protein
MIVATSMKTVLVQNRSKQRHAKMVWLSAGQQPGQQVPPNVFSDQNRLPMPHDQPVYPRPQLWVPQNYHSPPPFPNMGYAPGFIVGAHPGAMPYRPQGGYPGSPQNSPGRAPPGRPGPGSVGSHASQESLSSPGRPGSPASAQRRPSQGQMQRPSNMYPGSPASPQRQPSFHGAIPGPNGYAAGAVGVAAAYGSPRRTMGTPPSPLVTHLFRGCCMKQLIAFSGKIDLREMALRMTKACM